MKNPYYILYKGLKDLRAGNYSGSIVAIKVYLETSKTISIANSKLLYILSTLYRGQQSTGSEAGVFGRSRHHGYDTGQQR